MATKVATKRVGVSDRLASVEADLLSVLQDYMDALEGAKLGAQDTLRAGVILDRIGDAVQVARKSFDECALEHREGPWSSGKAVLSFKESDGRVTTSWKAVAEDEGRELADLKGESFHSPTWEARIKADARYSKAGEGKTKVVLVESA